MDYQKALDILKGAILLERRGKAFFEKSAQEVNNPALRQFFESMAEEEEGHIRFLGQHYTNLVNEGKFRPVNMEENPEEISDSVLTEQIRKGISAAGFEAAAIYAAMVLEEKAVQYYSEQARNATDPVEKEMYQWLANWEKTHLKVLNDIDRELQENVWYDNKFWPI